MRCRGRRETQSPSLFDVSVCLEKTDRSRCRDIQSSPANHATPISANRHAMRTPTSSGALMVRLTVASSYPARSGTNEYSVAERPSVMAAATGKSRTCAVREVDASVEGMTACTRLSVALVEEMSDAVLSLDARSESGSKVPSVTRLRVDSTVRKGRCDIATRGQNQLLVPGMLW